MQSCRTRFLFPSSKFSLERKPTFLRHSSSSANSAAPTLSWPEYLAIRNGRRTWQTAFTVPAGAAGLVAGSSYFFNLETDPTKMIFGIEPFFFYGICTVGCMGLGIVIGPSIGNFFWRFTHRRLSALIDAKDKQFYSKISKNRVDASLQTPTAPIPDYYGEKIGSLKDYRQWLRDQRKYRKKALLSEAE